MSCEYQKVVEEIRDLNWKSLDERNLMRLMHISRAAAQEFAEALRIARRTYPHDPNLAEMAVGELKTTNLTFADYNAKGDHSEFLTHFLKKYDFVADEELRAATDTYIEKCRTFPDAVRADTVFSREHELGSIFAAILKNKHWTTEALQAFRYYLARHIELDGADGGHADLVDQYPIDDAVLAFYETRRDMYRVIPELFQK